MMDLNKKTFDKNYPLMRQGSEMLHQAGRDLRLFHELEVYREELEMQNQQLRRAEAQALTASSRFAALFDHAPVGYLTLNHQGIIEEVNLMSARILGTQRQNLRQTELMQYMAPESLPVFRDFLDRVFHSGNRQECEICMIPEGIPVVYVSLHGALPEEGYSCLLTITDITKRKLAEKALQENETRLKELNSTKDKFFSIISHDLKSPFTSIIGLSNLMLAKVRSGEYQDLEEYAGYIQISANRAMDLLNNLLQWSSSQTGKIHFEPTEVDLAELVMEVKNLLWDSAMQKKIYISDQIARRSMVWADKTMISTVLRNLIGNAIKFTRAEGKIILSAEQRPGELVVKVQDNGVGMGQNIREKLFRMEKGRSTLGTDNETGTGLGLLICKEFIAMHGGNIWVESLPGEGSTFYFTIPWWKS